MTQRASPDDAFRAVVARLLEVNQDALAFEALSGGVSSDIWRVDSPHGRYCAKRALPRLRVAARWEAPVSRNAEEVRWLNTARRWVGDQVAEVVAADETAGVALLAWYDPDHWHNWKQALLDGQVNSHCAAALGALLGTVAARAAAEPGLAGEFANDHLFEALRVDPFFRYALPRHAELEPVIAELETARETLVHGDFSPKNVLVDRAGRVRVLDAETACWGSAAFDPGYLLGHLLIKQLHTGNRALVEAAQTFWRSYEQALDVPFPDLGRRVRLILGGMLLARVDGKSPVEYLTADGRARVRARGLAILNDASASLEQTLDRWIEESP